MPRRTTCARHPGGPGAALPTGRAARAEGEDPRLPPRPQHPGQLHHVPRPRWQGHNGRDSQGRQGRVRAGGGEQGGDEHQDPRAWQGRRGAAEWPVQVQQQGPGPPQRPLSDARPQQEAELRQLHPEEGEDQAEDPQRVAEVHQVAGAEEEEEEAEEENHADAEPETEESVRPDWSLRFADEGRNKSVQ